LGMGRPAQESTPHVTARLDQALAMTVSMWSITAV
jgi:hypothetical protein